jgi:cystathionine gamma-lyase
VPSPFDCFLAHRGLKTLHLRMEAAGRNALAVAIFLESHPGVARVVYPGLLSHPQHELATKQQHGFGAMITFYCRGGRPQSAVFLQKVRVCIRAFACIVINPRIASHAFFAATIVSACRVSGCGRIVGGVPVADDSCVCPDEERAKLGIDDTLVRLSVGIESCSDLIRDLDQALIAALKSLES